MRADAVSLLAIFEKKMRIEVPLFQRQYVWTKEQQWEPLWEDIKRKFSDYLDGRTDTPVHFLGAIVLDQKQTEPPRVSRRLHSLRGWGHEKGEQVSPALLPSDSCPTRVRRLHLSSQVVVVSRGGPGSDDESVPKTGRAGPIWHYVALRGTTWHKSAPYM